MNKPFESKDDFEIIFKEYFEVLCNYVNQYIRNWENSREIVQNTFTRIWIKKDSIQINNTVKNYLYKSCKNNMIDFIRKNKQEVELSEELIATIEDKDSKEGIDAATIKRGIIRGLKTLKPKNRKIFELSKFEGLTHKEIANHLDISERSVEDNVARALKLLKIYLENNENIF